MSISLGNNRNPIWDNQPDIERISAVAWIKEVMLKTVTEKLNILNHPITEAELNRLSNQLDNEAPAILEQLVSSNELRGMALTLVKDLLRNR